MIETNSMLTKITEHFRGNNVLCMTIRPTDCVIFLCGSCYIKKNNKYTAFSLPTPHFLDYKTARGRDYQVQILVRLFLQSYTLFSTWDVSIFVSTNQIWEFCLSLITKVNVTRYSCFFTSCRVGLSNTHGLLTIPLLNQQPNQRTSSNSRPKTVEDGADTRWRVTWRSVTAAQEVIYETTDTGLQCGRRQVSRPWQLVSHTDGRPGARSEYFQHSINYIDLP